jgi:membrane protein implicated in regulation of membrane protease activity
MQIDLYVWWLILAIILIITEILSGTVYLLFLSIVCGIVALMAWYHIAFVFQALFALVISILGVYLIHKFVHKQNGNYKTK